MLKEDENKRKPSWINAKQIMLVKQLHLQQSNTELSCLIQILCFRIWIPSAQANTSQHRTFRNFQGACQEVLKATKYVTRLTPPAARKQWGSSSASEHQGQWWIFLDSIARRQELPSWHLRFFWPNTRKPHLLPSSEHYEWEHTLSRVCLVQPLGASQTPDILHFRSQVSNSLFLQLSFHT